MYDGKKMGDTSPKVSDYQKPMSQFPDKQEGKANDYNARQNRIQDGWAAKQKANAYKGRYS